MAARRLVVEIVGDASQLERTFVRSSAATNTWARSVTGAAGAGVGLSRSAQGVERDVGKATRGALAGVGAIAGLGRSLAFASGGFLVFAGLGNAIRASVTGAEDLAKAQDSARVAIEHTGASVAKLIPQYEDVSKRAAQFGVSETDALSGLAKATALTGSAEKALRAYQEALVLSKGAHVSFASALTATAKGQEGITTSLKRYGIEVAKGASGLDQFRLVMARFGGQATANTSEADRFRAILANTEATIGTALLPTLDKYLGELGSWLQKMNDSGRLQRDVNSTLRTAGTIFHALGDAVRVVDKVTGSFKNTLEILAAFKFASLVTGWIGSLKLLAAEWGLVRVAATEATAAEGLAGGAGGAGLALSARTRANLPSVFDQYAGGAATGAAARASLGSRFLGFASSAAGAIAGAFTLGDLGGTEHGGFSMQQVTEPDGGTYMVTTRNGKVVGKVLIGFIGNAVITPQLRNLPRTGNVVPPAFQVPGFQPQRPNLPPPLPGQGSGVTNFGVSPIAVYKTFALTVSEQLAQAQAALTQSTQDDVAAAKGVIARIKRLIDQGHLSGQSLIQALQAEGSALSTIWSAEAAAAQKRAAAAAAVKARIQAEIQNSIDPLSLEVNLSRDQAEGRSTLKDLIGLRNAARKALASGRLNLTQQKEAYDQITSLNQQIKDARTSATSTFVAPAKLQLALAKDQALGTDQTKDLLKLKAAILKFIATHKKNIQDEIDAYNQLAQVNQQLGSTAQSALDLFKQASTKALTAGLGLTASQRAALRARLSQLGPGGTVPATGTGAAGYAIDPKTDRPLVVHTHVHLKDREIGNAVTKVQQRQRSRNPTQRRGPNALQDI